MNSGWKFLDIYSGRTRKAHYFDENGRSLCGNYGSFWDENCEDYNHNSPDNCATCKKKLQKILNL